MGRGIALVQCVVKRIHFSTWWIVVFTTLCGAFYFQAAHSRALALSELSSRMHEMEGEKLRVLQDREDLNLQLQSESDPAWQELVLMKELGVVPEGYTKIQFQK